MRSPNSIDSRKAATEKTSYVGRRWYYPFFQIPSLVADVKVARTIQKLSSRYAKLTRDWTAVDNSVWVCRTFMAMKLIMMATVQVNSLEFAEKTNLRVVRSHLSYYALLSLARALCLTIPEEEWSEGALLKMSHERAISRAVAHVQSLDVGLANSLDVLARSSKAQREMIDYRAPSSGDLGMEFSGDFLPFCRLLAELAQMNSELLEQSLEKHAIAAEYALVDEVMRQLLAVEIEGQSFLDSEDIGRMGYLARKHPEPTSILMLMTDGHVDDFFGAWGCGEGRSNTNIFNPDLNKGIIFDIP